MLTVLRLCGTGCKLHEMLQVLVRTASWACARWSNFILKIGWLVRCSKFSAPAAGKAPHGAGSFLRGGGRAKKGGPLVDKSAIGAHGHADPALLGLGPLR